MFTPLPNDLQKTNENQQTIASPSPPLPRACRPPLPRSSSFTSSLSEGLIRKQVTLAPEQSCRKGEEKGRRAERVGFPSASFSWSPFTEGIRSTGFLDLPWSSPRSRLIDHILCPDFCVYPWLACPRFSIPPRFFCLLFLDPIYSGPQIGRKVHYKS